MLCFESPSSGIPVWCKMIYPGASLSEMSSSLFFLLVASLQFQADTHKKKEFGRRDFFQTYWDGVRLACALYCIVSGPQVKLDQLSGCNETTVKILSSLKASLLVLSVCLVPSMF